MVDYFGKRIIMQKPEAIVYSLRTWQLVSYLMLLKMETVLT